VIEALVENLLEQDFKDTFKPITKDELRKRHQSRTDELVSKAEGWVKRNRRKIRRIAEEYDQVYPAVMRLREELGGVLRASPWLIQRFLYTKTGTFRGGYVSGVSNTSVKKGLDILSSLKPSDIRKIRRTALNLAKKGE
jgi:hypothetical protein